MTMPKPSSQNPADCIAGSHANVANERVPQPSGFGTSDGVTRPVEPVTANPPMPADSQSAERASEEWRDPRFAELEAAIKAENVTRPQEPVRRTARDRQPRKRQRAGRERAPLAQAMELVRQLGKFTRGEFGHLLNRAEFIRVAQEFRSAVVPRRKPGPKPSLRVTRASADYQAGKRGLELYRDHIHGYDRLGRPAQKRSRRRLMAAIRTRRRRERRCLGPNLATRN
jgi:hypothetical protein